MHQRVVADKVERLEKQRTKVQECKEQLQKDLQQLQEQIAEQDAKERRLTEEIAKANAELNDVRAEASAKPSMVDPLSAYDPELVAAATAKDPQLATVLQQYQQATQGIQRIIMVVEQTKREREAAAQEASPTEEEDVSMEGEFDTDQLLQDLGLSKDDEQYQSKRQAAAGWLQSVGAVKKAKTKG